MAVKIQFRRDTAANWQNTNPILSQGELGLDITNNRFKLGDGATAWNQLNYTIDLAYEFQPDGDYNDLRARATTAEDVGLGNVNNTSDASKPVSTATQTALNLKAEASTFFGHTGDNTIHFLKTDVSQSDVGLGNVDNESKATMFTNPTFTGTVSGVTKTHVGLGNVTNDAQIPASEKGEAGGVAELDGSGLVPSDQLPSYVDDVLEGFFNPDDDLFYTDSQFTGGNEITGETGKIYVDTSTGEIYRYTGTIYVQITNPLDIASQAEAEAGANDAKAMTPLKTKQAIQSIAIDGGAWVSPVVEFTNISFDEVSFTIENQEDYEVDVKYELNSPPTENSVTLAANTTSATLTLSSLTGSTNYILYAQSFLDNDAISEVSAYPFTTAVTPDDPTGSPGETMFTESAEPLTGYEDLGPVGFFGTVTAEEFAGTNNDLSDVLDTLGFADGTDINYQNTTDPVLKFRHNNKIKFITQKSIGYGVSWDQIDSIIDVYGGTSITLNGVTYKARLMRGWGQVSGSEDSVTTPDYENGPIYTVNFDKFSDDSGVNWPTDTSDWSANNPNEWNTLMFPIHEDSSSQSQTGNVPDWASYSNSDLNIDDGNGTAQWMQENTPLSNRLARGENLTDIESKNSNEASENGGTLVGLRLVFEIDVPGETVFFPSEVSN